MYIGLCYLIGCWGDSDDVCCCGSVVVGIGVDYCGKCCCCLIFGYVCVDICFEVFGFVVGLIEIDDDDVCVGDSVVVIIDSDLYCVVECICGCCYDCVLYVVVLWYVFLECDGFLCLFDGDLVCVDVVFGCVC